MADLAELVTMFTRARYAAWAGDLRHCRDLLNRARAQSADLNETDRSWDSLGMLLHATDELLARIGGEETATEDAKPSETKSIPDDAGLILTQHLRGVIHRTGDYDFELKAYLDDLDWESDLYRRASVVAERYSRPSLRERVKRIRRQELADRKNVEVRRPSASWRIVGNTIIRVVSLGPFGLIKVRATWTREDPPNDFGEIRISLEEVLREIEHSEQQAENLVESQR
jgi:hypothetical protein